eukprot:7928360-Pyramimonas_sp.AAC.1
MSPVMGSSWAVFLAHSCLSDALESLPDINLGQITYGRPTPSFEKVQLMLLLYIDDYIGLKLCSENGEELELDREKVKAHLVGQGLP